jgi:hypothetical protein
METDEQQAKLCHSPSVATCSLKGKGAWRSELEILRMWQSRYHSVLLFLPLEIKTIYLCKFLLPFLTLALLLLWGQSM